MIARLESAQQRWARHPAPDGLAAKVDRSREAIQLALETFDPRELAVAWTGGKDSTVVLHLLRQMHGGEVPLRVFFNDSGMEFAEVYEFVTALAAAWRLDLVTESHDEAELARFRAATSSQVRRRLSRVMKISAIQRAIDRYGFTAFLVGIRWDEHPARADERYFSPRPGHMRIHPILHFTEADVWRYTRRYGVPYVALYDQGYRSLGEAPFTGKVAEDAPERAGREPEKESLMDELRQMGYW